MPSLPSPLKPLPLRSCPLLWAALVFGLGVVTAAYGGLPGWVWGALAGVALVLAVGAVPRRRLVSLRRLGLTAAAALAVFAGGGAHLQRFADVPADHVARVAALEQETVRLTGRIVSFPVSKNGTLRFELDADTLTAPARDVTVSGRVLATLYAPFDSSRTYPMLHRGDRLRLEGRLHLPPLRRNPSDFDYGAFLHRQCLHATLAASSPDALLEHDPAPVFTARQRTRVEQALLRTIPSETARSLLSALLLGDRSALADDVTDAFARTGLMHLLAVSGLHVLLIGMLLYRVLRPLLMRLGGRWAVVEWTRAVVTVAVLLGYVLLVGAPASAVRAFVMAAVFIGGAVSGRVTQPLNALGAAALVLLAARPTALFDVGFQLSFAAVGGLLLLMPRMNAVQPRWAQRGAGGYAWGLVVVSFVATLATAPVVLFHFGQVPLAGLVLNTLAIPLTFAGLLAGVFAVAAELLAGNGVVFGAAADLCFRLLVGVAVEGERVLAFSLVQRFVRSGWVIAAATAGLLTWAAWPRPRLRWRLASVAGGLLLVGAVAGWRTDPTGLEVLFFDVGHGDAALVSTPSGRHLLIDAGGRDAWTDHGLRTLVPHLRRHAVRRLDAVVLSHPHADHYGGLLSLAHHLPIGRVLDNGQSADADLYAATYGRLDSLGIPHARLTTGDTLAFDPAVRLHVLYPDATARTGDTNDASVVLRLTYGSTAFLFTGDIGTEAERRLAAHAPHLLRADVLKVAHHGSRTSSTPAFLTAVQPSVAVVSVRRGTRYGLPDEEIEAALHAAADTVLVTDDTGAVWLRSNGTTVTHLPWRSSPHWIAVLRRDLVCSVQQ